VTTLLRIRLALSVIGLILFVYGVRIDEDGTTEDDRLRWIGIAFLAASLLLRIWRGRRPPAD
jgi:protein-S-isoprenylcysteine O-methyltransferase Ste14